MNPSMLARFLTAFLVLSTVEALGQTAPVISGRPTEAQRPVARINIEDTETEDAPFRLSWGATIANGTVHGFELTYDRVRVTADSTVALVRLDAASAPLFNNVSGTFSQSNDAETQREQIDIRITQVLDPDMLEGGARAANDATREIKLRVFANANEFAEATTRNFTWYFEYDTVRPPAPTLLGVTAGDRRLLVQWDAPADASDVDQYEILFCPDVRSTTVSASQLPCEEPELQRARFSSTQRSGSVTTNLQNGVRAAVAVRAIDLFTNTGPNSQVQTETPAEVLDFWQVYRTQGGPETGGFCFVATAAYGSYAHPVVQALRWFRDGVLKSNPLGTGLVWLYYRMSPPLADWIAGDEALRGPVRATLVVLVLGILFLLGLPLFWLLRFGVRQVYSRCKSASALGLGLGLIGVIWSGVAEAGPRPKSSIDPVGLTFEFHGGPYSPRIGRDSSEPGYESFKQVFGQETTTRPLYGLGMELQVYRGIGTAAIGGSFGFMQFVGRGQFADSGEVASDTTVFNILPLNLLLSYRFDWLVDHTAIPLVPYVRGGLAYYVWWITNGRGEVSDFVNPDTGQPESGSGGTFGLVGSVGISFILNTFDDRSARKLHNSVGVRGTYIFFEYQLAEVNGFGGDGFDFSDHTWNLGFMLEF
jgi:hypothetical protein